MSITLPLAPEATAELQQRGRTRRYPPALDLGVNVVSITRQLISEVDYLAGHDPADACQRAQARQGWPFWRKNCNIDSLLVPKPPGASRVGCG